jgi:hypothetical protein
MRPVYVNARYFVDVFVILRKQNKMKKQLLIALFMVFLLYAKAQELNVRLDAGYGFNLTPATATSQHLIRGSESDRTTYKNTLYSYGQGWNANAELEYFWGKHFGTGLGIGYLRSDKIETRYSETPVWPTYRQEYESTASMFRISPFVKFKFDLGQWSVFSRMGYLLGVAGQIDWRTNSIGHWFPIESHEIYHKGLSHGATAGLGGSYRLSPRFSLSAEARLFVHSFGPRKGELISIVGLENNNDVPNLIYGQVHTDFLDEYTEPYPFESREWLDQPAKQLRQFYPFSSIGLNLGLQYQLNPAAQP